MHRSIGIPGLILVGAIALVPTLPVASASPDPTIAPLGDGEEWIVYGIGERRGHTVHIVRTDGTGEVFPLAAVPGGQQLHPDWSPDGRRIVFDVEDADGTGDLWIADTADWSAEMVVPCDAPCLWVNEPAWSHDRASIAFQRHTQTEEGEISTVEILDLATGALRTVTTSGPDVQLYAPRWSADDSQLVVEMPSFTEEVGLLGDALGIVDAAGPSTQEPRIVVPGTAMANNPDWSPDGTLLVFSAPAEGGEVGGARSDLWVAAPDGTGMRQLTDVASAGGSATQPTFTPDGQRVVFKLTGVPGYNDTIAVIALDGSGLAPATSTPVMGWHPRLRPTP